MTHEPQTLNIALSFTVNHNPGNKAHLDAIAENYFRPKGVKYKDGIITI